MADGATNGISPRVGRRSYGLACSHVLMCSSRVLAVIVFSTGHFLDGLFAGLIVANSVIGIVQEPRAKRTLDRLVIVGQAYPACVGADAW